MAVFWDCLRRSARRAVERMTTSDTDSDDAAGRVPFASPDSLDVLWALLRVDPDAPPDDEGQDEEGAAETPSEDRG